MAALKDTLPDCHVVMWIPKDGTPNEKKARRLPLGIIFYSGNLDLLWMVEMNLKRHETYPRREGWEHRRYSPKAVTQEEFDKACQLERERLERMIQGDFSPVTP